LDTGALAQRVRAGDRAALGRAITLVESTRGDHRAAAASLLAQLGDGPASTRRVGITGVPGVGKSTFIDALGMKLVEAGHRVGVLAVDPSSVRTGGSILGDKTRMPRLAVESRAFVRPSPTGGTLGGVARATRETMALLEGGGYDVVVVETVGIGQAEVEVANMVDTFLVLALARSGDELQGIKKGVLELADVIAVNKADQGHEGEARSAAAELRQAIHLLQGDGTWTPPVLTCSALEDRGLDEVWEAVERHRAALQASGELEDRRRRQRVRWMWATAESELLSRLRRARGVRELAAELTGRVERGEMPAGAAADQLLRAFERPAGVDP
jgi:LAO/AO transport system kinase